MRVQSLILNFFFAIVWFVNGFYCKVLNLVPRHQLIVSEILGEEYSIIITKTIGVLEILMGIWILSGYKKKFNAVTQIVIILLMNIIEYFLVPELLLWNRYNILFALVLVLLIYFNGFVLTKNKSHGII